MRLMFIRAITVDALPDLLVVVCVCSARGFTKLLIWAYPLTIHTATCLSPAPISNPPSLPPHIPSPWSDTPPVLHTAWPSPHTTSFLSTSSSSDRSFVVWYSYVKLRVSRAIWFFCQDTLRVIRSTWWVRCVWIGVRNATFLVSGRWVRGPCAWLSGNWGHWMYDRACLSTCQTQPSTSCTFSSMHSCPPPPTSTKPIPSPTPSFDPLLFWTPSQQTPVHSPIAPTLTTSPVLFWLTVSM